MKLVNTLGEWFKRNTYTLLVVAAILVVWEIYTQFFNEIGNIFFPSISYTVEQTVTNWQLIESATRITLSEVFVGFLMGVVMGLLIGILFAESYIIRQATMPMVVFFYSLPFAIIAPIFIVWFGTGILAVGAFVALFSFYPIFINTITGFTHVDEEFYHLAEVCGASRFQFVSKIKFWVAFPHVVGGIKVAVQQSVVGAIVAEFIASGGGLGNEILVAAQTSRLGLLFGILFFIMLIAILYYKVVSRVLEIVVPGPAREY